MREFLNDTEFLYKLDRLKIQVHYTKIIILDFNTEEPVKEIQGMAVSGTVNVNGSSAIRRTMNVVLQVDERSSDIRHLDTLIGINTKIQIFTGIQNPFKEYQHYGEIIWFPQGTFVVNSAQFTRSSNGCVISIQGQDKMVLLNGFVGGTLPASTTFTSRDILNKDGSRTVEHPTIKQIIYEAVHHIGEIPAEKIIISDLDDTVKLLVRYKGNKPLYFEKEYQHFVIGDLDNTTDYLNPISYNEDVGYQITSFTYPGEIVMAAGETVQGLLDKIVQTLGNYEYFFDIDGNFVFQEKKNYLNTSYTPIVNIENDMYVRAFSDTKYQWALEDGETVLSYQVSPKYADVKNDFVVWGTRTSDSGYETGIRYHLAVDEKPRLDLARRTMWQTIEYSNNVEPRTPLTPAEMQIEYLDEIATRKDRDDLLKCYEHRANLKVREDPNYAGLYYWVQRHKDEEGFFESLGVQSPENWYGIQNVNQLLSVIMAREETESDSFKSFRTLKVEQYNWSKDISNTNAQSLINIHLIGGAEYTGGEQAVADWLEACANDYDATLHPDRDPAGLVKYIGNAYNAYDAEYQLWKLRTDGKFEESDLSYYEKAKSILLYWFGGNSLLTYSYTYANPTRKEYVQDNSIRTLVGGPCNDWREELYRQALERQRLGSAQLTYDEELLAEWRKLYDPTNDAWAKNYQNWNPDVYLNPHKLDYWLDFIDSDAALAQYSVKAIGRRTKAVNDDKVKVIYNKDVPDILFLNNFLDLEEMRKQLPPGQTTNSQDPIVLKNIIQEYYKERGQKFFWVLPNQWDYFSASSTPKSAYDEIRSLVYQHLVYNTTITINCQVKYYLEPNYLIYIEDEKSSIAGNYVITQFSVPLAYNGTMNLVAVEALTRV